MVRESGKGEGHARRTTHVVSVLACPIYSVVFRALIHSTTSLPAAASLCPWLRVCRPAHTCMPSTRPSEARRMRHSQSQSWIWWPGLQPKCPSKSQAHRGSRQHPASFLLFRAQYQGLAPTAGRISQCIHGQKLSAGCAWECRHNRSRSRPIQQSGSRYQRRREMACHIRNQ